MLLSRLQLASKFSLETKQVTCTAYVLKITCSCALSYTISSYACAASHDTQLIHWSHVLHVLLYMLLLRPSLLVRRIHTQGEWDVQLVHILSCLVSQQYALTTIFIVLFILRCCTIPSSMTGDDYSACHMLSKNSFPLAAAERERNKSTACRSAKTQEGIISSHMRMYISSHHNMQIPSITTCSVLPCMCAHMLYVDDFIRHIHIITSMDVPCSHAAGLHSPACAGCLVCVLPPPFDMRTLTAHNLTEHAQHRRASR